MLWVVLYFLSFFEVRIDSAFIPALPLEKSHKAFKTLTFMQKDRIKLPLYADWINTLDDYILVMRNDSLFYYSPRTLDIDSIVATGLKGIERIYTDSKGKIIVVKNKNGFYLNGKKRKIRIYGDTVNIVKGKIVVSDYRSPLYYGKILYYINEHGRVVMKVPVDTTGTAIINARYEVLPSFLGYEGDSMLVYTFNGKLFHGFNLLKDNLPHGIASMRNDTVFVYDLKDSAYALSYPNMKLIGKTDLKNTPFSEIRSDFEGKVYLNGKIIYRDKYLVSANLYDIDFDGIKEVVLGRMDGSFAVLKRFNGAYQEFMSYYPDKSLYRRYLPVSGIPLFYFTPLEKSPFAFVLDTLNPMYLDEYLYVLTHASPEFIDTLMKIGADYLYKNIFDIYLAARRLKYVSLYELPDGRTTLILNKKDTLPSDIYYEYVVFPRVLYEFPEKPLFREFFINDRSFGKSVLEVVENDTTVIDAVHSLYRWAKSFMHFGYMTNDLQPVTIYRKAYGSCGEHSILSAALFKTILIPSYVAVDMGEDHQWNEFYDGRRWVHFDLTQNEEKAIDNPFASSEGLGNKEVSAVVGVSPSGKYFPITSHGYTKTGRIVVSVVDSKDNPVPFALVVLRSHWNGRNSVSFFKYTDKDGLVYFDAGREKLGYGIDVFSPYGKGGIGNFYIEEGDTVHLLVKLWGKIGKTGGRKKEARMLVFGRNFRTGETEVFIKSGYLYQSDDGSVFNPYLNTLGILKVKDTMKAESKPPFIEVNLKDTVIENGLPLIVSLEVNDNLGVRSVHALIYGKKVNREFWLPVRNGFDTVFVNEDTVIPEGVYKITFIAEDFSGNTSQVAKSIVVRKTSFFKKQRIKQDPVGTDRGSWNYIFEVNDTLPFLYVQTRGHTQRMDIDLFLKKDGKVVKKSTSPTSSESMYLHPLLPGKYTVTVQGWHVPSKKGIFDIKVVY